MSKQRQIKVISFKILVEQIDLVLLLGEGGQAFRLAFYVLDVPLTLEVLPLVLGRGEDCTLSAVGAFDSLLFVLHFLLDGFLWFFLLLELLLLLLQLVNELQGTELLTLQSLVLLVDNDSNEDFDDHLVELLADLVDFSVLVGLDVVDPDYLGSLDLLLLDLVDFQLLQPRLQLLEHFLLTGEADLHLSSRDLVPLLEELDAVQCLLLGGLVELEGEVDVLDGLLDVLRSEAALGDGVHALFHNDLDYVCEDVARLSLPLLIADLQLSPLEDDLDDLPLGLAGEELVEVGLLCEGAVRGILVDLLDLQDLGKILLESVPPVDCLVAVAGDLKGFVIDFVADGRHVCHPDFGIGQLQHYSFINLQSLRSIQSAAALHFRMEWEVGGNDIGWRGKNDWDKGKQSLCRASIIFLILLIELIPPVIIPPAIIPIINLILLPLLVLLLPMLLKLPLLRLLRFLVQLLLLLLQVLLLPLLLLLSLPLLPLQLLFPPILLVLILEVHKFFRDGFDDAGEAVRIPLLVADHSLAEDDLDDLPLGLFGEVKFEKVFIGDDFALGIPIDLIELEDFGQILKLSAPPSFCQDAVADDLKGSFSDLVADDYHIGHFQIILLLTYRVCDQSRPQLSYSSDRACSQRNGLGS